MTNDIPDSYVMPDEEVAEIELPPEPEFDLKSAPIPSFGALQAARTSVYRSMARRESCRRLVESLAASGEDGRRKGLGYWLLGEFDQAAEQLAKFPADDVASFTRAQALMSAERFAEAQPIFERLSNSYPEEPRPRGGRLEARLEADLKGGDSELASKNLEEGLRKAPPSFVASAEGQYIHGRAAELARDWERALECYEAARELDAGHRSALFRFGYLAERYGLDQEALIAYQTLAHLPPMDRNALINLGALYEDLGRDQEAASCFDTVAKNHPTDKRVRLFLEDARQGISMYYDEDLERKEDRLNQILRTPITDFELSVRARNCLNKMNILTLGDLVRRTEQELLSYKNFGETSLNEIKQILASKGLRLGMQHHEAVASIESTVRPKATGENAEILNKPISELDLSIRARRAVENLGCLTVGDMVQHNEEELLSMPNFGQTSLSELKRKLAEIGLSLGDRAKA